MGFPTPAASKGKKQSPFIMSHFQEVEAVALRTGSQTALLHPLGSWKQVVLDLTWARKKKKSEDVSVEVSTHLKVRSLSPIKAKLAPSKVSTTSFPMVSGCLAATSLFQELLPEGRSKNGGVGMGMGAGGGRTRCGPAHCSFPCAPPAPTGRFANPLGVSQSCRVFAQSLAPRLKATVAWRGF